MKKNKNFFAGLEDDEEQFEEANFVDQNLDDDGEIEPVITEEDVPEDGKSPDADVVSVEDFDHFFNNDDLGLEDDEDAAIDEGDGADEAPTVNVSVDIETGDDDGGEDVGGDAGDETDTGSDDAAGEESYDIFGFEDDDPVDQAAEVSDEGEGDDTGAGDETDTGTDEGDDTGAGDDDISVDVNINVNVDDGTSGDDGDDTGSDAGTEEPAADSGEISQEDFDFGTMGLEDDTPEVNVEITVDGEEQETVSTSDDGDDTETTSDDPVDQAAELSDDGEGSEEPDPEETGTEEDEDDDLGEESFFGDLW